MLNANVAYISGQLTTKANAVHTETTEVDSDLTIAMGRIKISVTAGESDVSLKTLSGYFASGKAFTAGAVKVGDGAYKKITGTSTLTKTGDSQTGIKVDDFSVGETISAGATKDVYILLGKTSAPSAGVTIEVAEVVLDFETATAE